MAENLTDEEIKRLAQDIERREREAYEQECTQRYLDFMAKRDADDHRFAQELGITWAQYEAVKYRVQEQDWEDR